MIAPFIPTPRERFAELQSRVLNRLYGRAGQTRLIAAIGDSQYDALQTRLERRFSDGYQFDFNYTYAVAKDHGSSVERGAAFGNFATGGYSGSPFPCAG